MGRSGPATSSHVRARESRADAGSASWKGSGSGDSDSSGWNPWEQGQGAAQGCSLNHISPGGEGLCSRPQGGGEISLPGARVVCSPISGVLARDPALSSPSVNAWMPLIQVGAPCEGEDPRKRPLEKAPEPSALREILFVQLEGHSFF